MFNFKFSISGVGFPPQHLAVRHIFSPNVECVYKCALNVQSAHISFNKFTVLQRVERLKP